MGRWMKRIYPKDPQEQFAMVASALALPIIVVAYWAVLMVMR
ncbi:hypothetical protein [Gorillibacterium sp. CAU 1737]